MEDHWRPPPLFPPIPSLLDAPPLLPERRFRQPTPPQDFFRPREPFPEHFGPPRLNVRPLLNGDEPMQHGIRPFGPRESRFPLRGPPPGFRSDQANCFRPPLDGHRFQDDHLRIPGPPMDEIFVETNHGPRFPGECLPRLPPSPHIRQGLPPIEGGFRDEPFFIRERLEPLPPRHFIENPLPPREELFPPMHESSYGFTDCPRPFPPPEFRRTAPRHEFEEERRPVSPHRFNEEPHPPRPRGYSGFSPPHDDRFTSFGVSPQLTHRDRVPSPPEYRRPESFRSFSPDIGSRDPRKDVFMDNCEPTGYSNGGKFDEHIFSPMPTDRQMERLPPFPHVQDDLYTKRSHSTCKNVPKVKEPPANANKPRILNYIQKNHQLLGNKSSPQDRPSAPKAKPKSTFEKLLSDIYSEDSKLDKLLQAPKDSDIVSVKKRNCEVSNNSPTRDSVPKKKRKIPLNIYSNMSVLDCINDLKKPVIQQEPEPPPPVEKIEENVIEVVKEINSEVSCGKLEVIAKKKLDKNLPQRPDGTTPTDKIFVPDDKYSSQRKGVVKDSSLYMTSFGTAVMDSGVQTIYTGEGVPFGLLRKKMCREYRLHSSMEVFRDGQDECAFTLDLKKTFPPFQKR